MCLVCRIWSSNITRAPGELNAHLNWRKLPLVHIGVCYQLEKLWRPSPWLLFTYRAPSPTCYPPPGPLGPPWKLPRTIFILHLRRSIWVRILNDVQLAIFRPWALLLHLVRPQLLRNHFCWCRRKEYNQHDQGFQETYLPLLIFVHHTGLQMQKYEKKWCFYTFSFFRNHPVNFQATLLILSNYSVNLVCLGPVS